MAAALLIDAIDTALAIADAVLVWIAVGAAALTVVLFTGVLTGVWAWRAVRRRHAPASQPQTVSCDSRDADEPPSPSRARSVPSWAQTDHDHQEAA